MPELPEVETIANDLRKAGIIGKTIRGAENILAAVDQQYGSR